MNRLSARSVRRFAARLAVGAVLAAGPLPASAQSLDSLAAALFPIEVGNEWVYDYYDLRCPHHTQGSCQSYTTTFTFRIVDTIENGTSTLAVVDGPGGQAAFGLVENEYQYLEPHHYDLVVTNDTLPRVPDYHRLDIATSESFPLTTRVVQIGGRSYTLDTYRKTEGNQAEFAPGIGLLYSHPTFHASGGRRHEYEWTLTSAVIGGQAYGLAATSDEPAPESAGALRAFPNPAAGPVTVEVRTEAPGPVRVVVYDRLGREVAVLHDGPVGDRVTLSAAGLAPGTYVVRAMGRGLDQSSTFAVVR